LLEIDFCGDAPALRNEFKVWLTSGFFEGSSVADAPGWFRSQFSSQRTKRLLREEYQQVTSDDLLAVCRNSYGSLHIQRLKFPACGGYQLLSDEAVESIGSENYVRMVPFLGQHTVDDYFMKNMRGLT
jgi:hypothetical protein